MPKTRIFLFSLILNLIKSYIIVPFQGNNLSQIFNNNEKTEFLEDFMKSTYNNHFYTTLEIGTPSQYVVLSLVPNDTDFVFNKDNCFNFYNNKYIDKNSLIQINKDIPINVNSIGYKRELSNSFSKNNNSKPVFYNKNYYFGTEKLRINDYRNVLLNDNETQSQYHLETFGLIYEELNINETGNDTEICGSLGLTLYFGKNNNHFIHQLKTLNITNNYFWSFNYSSLDKGHIIF
jgi:hypothetical protein